MSDLDIEVVQFRSVVGTDVPEDTVKYYLSAAGQSGIDQAVMLYLDATVGEVTPASNVPVDLYNIQSEDEPSPEAQPERPRPTWFQDEERVHPEPPAVRHQSPSPPPADYQLPTNDFNQADDDDDDYERPTVFGHRAPRSHGASHDIVLLPDDVDREEARMLESAYLGVPYEGRMPGDEFTAGSSQPASTEVVAARSVRAEQDEAYQRSLQADQVKQREAEEAEQSAAEARRQLAEEHSRQQNCLEQAAQTLQWKAERLPAEPDGSDPMAVMLQVRTHSGERLVRRFLREHPLEAVFDFVDVERARAAEGDAGLLPQPEFNLVTQFPRRVLTRDERITLADAGLTARQESLFMEVP